MDKHFTTNPEIGTRVKIDSKTSKCREKYGTAVSHCKGKYTDCCMVNIDGGKTVRFCCRMLLPADEDTGNTPDFDVQEGSSKENAVTVRWFDGYLEEFEATEVRFGSDILFLRLADGKNRHIPLRQVRWFGMSVESHQNWEEKQK